MNNNKRIAKNTLFLYVRMLVTLTVSLYTSRIVLRYLGIEDFGINSVVAGVVSMFVFLNTTMATGTQRFLSFALGEKNFKKQQLTFSTTFIVHLVLALLLGLITFVGGYYFLNTQLNIPVIRMEAAHYVLYCSIITVVLNISQVPYMSSIIAHEDMSVYAYMSIFDAIMKLLVAYGLILSTGDKLQLYAILLLVVSFLNMMIYRVYCICKYKECRVKLLFDKQLLKSILTFSGWNVIGCTAVLCNNQGFNILLNVFFGPVVNAARGISMQVNSVALQFVNNFQAAATPQIIKYYAENEIEHMIRLINNNARYAGLLILFVIVPLGVEIEFLLNFWLGAVPDETAFFTRIVLFQSFLQTLSHPIVVGIHAVGRMRAANVLAGSALMLVLPLSYILLKSGVLLHWVLIINLVPWFIENIIDVTLLNKYIGFSIKKYYTSVYFPFFILGLIAIVPLIFFHNYIEDACIRFGVVCIFSLIWSAFLFYRFGINENIRNIIKVKIGGYIWKRLN